MKKMIFLAACLIGSFSEITPAQVTLPEEVIVHLRDFKTSGDHGSLVKARSLLEQQKIATVEGMIRIRLAFLESIWAAYDPDYDIIPPPLIRSHVEPP